MTRPTPQDGEGLVSEERIDAMLTGYFGGSWDAVEAADADQPSSPIRQWVRAALSAVAPDIAGRAFTDGQEDGRGDMEYLERKWRAEERQRCSDELMRMLRTPGKGFAHLGALAEKWGTN